MLIQQEKEIAHLVNWQITDNGNGKEQPLSISFFFFVGGIQLKNDNASVESRWNLRFPKTTKEEIH